MGLALRCKIHSLLNTENEALKTCRLKYISHLRVEGEALLSFATSLLSMPPDLGEGIKEFCGRVVGKVPLLTLTGFHETECDKLPGNWEVVIEHSEQYKQEVAALEKEWEESRAYAEGYGELQ